MILHAHKLGGVKLSVPSKGATTNHSLPLRPRLGPVMAGPFQCPSPARPYVSQRCGSGCSIAHWVKLPSFELSIALLSHTCCDVWQTERLLAGVDDWEFNIFTLEEVTQVMSALDLRN
jgi:hypothetical protein